MADILQGLNERIKALGGDWGKYSVVGSFLLYVFGYLALRFHLTVFGVGTDLAVLDERYLFTGARFLVYMATTIPLIVLFTLPVALFLLITRRLLPDKVFSRLGSYVMHPYRLVLFGVVYSVALIQCVLVKCLAFHDLLLTPQLPKEGGWLVDMLLGRGAVAMNLYFAILMAAAAVPVAIIAYTRGFQTTDKSEAFLRGLLALLASVQILMLPVNYGVLVVDLTLPRVAALGVEPLASGEDAWLAWEGKDGVTFLVRNLRQKRRKLLTMTRNEVKRMEITGADKIIQTLFTSSQGGRP